MSILLEELYNGNLFPCENVRPIAPRYNEVCREIDKEIEFWQKKLCQEEFKKIENLILLSCEQSDFDCKENFVQGFKMGAMMVIEVMSNYQ